MQLFHIVKGYDRKNDVSCHVHLYFSLSAPKKLHEHSQIGWDQGFENHLQEITHVLVSPVRFTEQDSAWCVSDKYVFYLSFSAFSSSTSLTAPLLALVPRDNNSQGSAALFHAGTSCPMPAQPPGTLSHYRSRSCWLFHPVPLPMGLRAGACPPQSNKNFPGRVWLCPWQAVGKMDFAPGMSWAHGKFGEKFFSRGYGLCLVLSLELIGEVGANISFPYKTCKISNTSGFQCQFLWMASPYYV